MGTKRLESDFVPSSYDELYTHYILGPESDSFCKKLIRSFLPFAEPDEVDSFAHDVFLRCVTHRMIERFNPEKANFGGVIFFVTRTVCCNHLNKKSRDPLGGLSVKALIDQTEDGETNLWDLECIVTECRGADQDAKDLVKRLMDRLDLLEIEEPSVRSKSLKILLDLLYQGYDIKECADRLGVTKSTIYNWLGFLRKEVEGI